VETKELRCGMNIVITQIVGWEKPDPIHKMVRTRESLPIVTLDKPSPRFREGEILHKGGIPHDPRGK
jgi:hypothetical protein